MVISVMTHCMVQICMQYKRIKKGFLRERIGECWDIFFRDKINVLSISDEGESDCDGSGMLYAGRTIILYRMYGYWWT